MRVAVVQGGPSLEAAVSRVSAAAVGEALMAAGHEVHLVELGPALPSKLTELQPEVVFPAVHGAQGEDGCLQGLLEVLGLPYVGSGVRGSSIAASKVATKIVYADAGLPVARQRVLDAASLDADSDFLFSMLKNELGPDLIMKPASGGSALGIVRLLDGATADEFAAGLDEIFAIDESVLIEAYIKGIELTCGVLDWKGSLVPLPPTQISAAASDWYDFQSKYSTGGSVHRCPAPLDRELTDAIQRAALLAHRALGLRDLSRTDVILQNGGEFILLETNTLPGMTSVSLFPEAAGVYGIPFPELVAGLCESARARGAFVARPETAMPD